MKTRKHVAGLIRARSAIFGPMNRLGAVAEETRIGAPKRAALRPALLAAAVLSATAPTAYAQTWTAEKAPQLDAIMALLSPAPLPSAVVAISINGEVVFSRGFGSIDNGTPNEHTAYRVASLSKQITAAAILTLVDRGVRVPGTGQPFTIDTRVADILDGVGGWGDLTVRHLLSHRGAITDFTVDNATAAGLDPGVGLDADTLLAAFKTFPRRQEDNYAYANINYFLLAEIVEAVNGMGQGSYHDYVREYVLRPAGMTETGFLGEEPRNVTVAPPIPRSPPPGTFRYPNWDQGNGDLVTTAADLHRWNAAFFGGRVVSPESLAAALTPQLATPNYPGAAYGLGWYITPTPDGERIWHRGWAGSGGSAINVVVRRPEGNWFAITIQANFGSPDTAPLLIPAADALVALVLQ